MSHLYERDGHFSTHSGRLLETSEVNCYCCHYYSVNVLAFKLKKKKKIIAHGHFVAYLSCSLQKLCIVHILTIILHIFFNETKVD